MFSVSSVFCRWKRVFFVQKLFFIIKLVVTKLTDLGLIESEIIRRCTEYKVKSQKTIYPGIPYPFRHSQQAPGFLGAIPEETSFFTSLISFTEANVFSLLAGCNVNNKKQRVGNQKHQ